ncbi:hypothetical protein SK128_021478 [Halocaridina rubra]|uniref:Uncharacterized protein n=1 Tax=Halocaridina rubra TaxID=373956 RepID=A0AAN9AFR9_HALRR
MLLARLDLIYPYNMSPLSQHMTLGLMLLLMSKEGIAVGSLSSMWAGHISLRPTGFGSYREVDTTMQ